MSSPSPPQCTAAPFGIALARARLLTALDDVARAGTALVAPDLPWAGHARRAYEDTVEQRRSGLLRLESALETCLARLDAVTVLAEDELARTDAAIAAGETP